MRRRHGHSEAPLSLFSFQDIMACLTGVLIMIVLVLALEGLADEILMERTAAAEPVRPAAAETEAELATQREATRDEIEALKRELAARQAGSAVTEAEVAVLEARLQRMRGEADRLERALEQRQQQLQAAQAQAAELAEQRAAAEAELARAERTLRKQRVQFRVGQAGGPRPFFVEMAAAGVRVGDLAEDGTPVLAAQLAPMATDGDVVAALAGRSPREQYPVFVVHGDSVERFEALRAALVRRGYEVGWQLWDGAAGAFLEPAPAGAHGVAPGGLPGGSP